MTIGDLKQCWDAGEPPQLIDVRSESEFAAGHVPGAVNIPMDQIESRLSDLMGHRPVLLICQSGKRAAMTAQLLEPHHGQVQVLEGGTAAWIEQGHPLVRTASSRWSLERQVRFGSGLIVLAGVALSMTVHPAWIWLSAFAGAGLSFAGLTDVCMMGSVLARMPWNKPSRNPASANSNGAGPACGGPACA